MSSSRDKDTSVDASEVEHDGRPCFGQVAGMEYLSLELLEVS